MLRCITPIKIDFSLINKKTLASHDFLQHLLQDIPDIINDTSKEGEVNYIHNNYLRMEIEEWEFDILNLKFNVEDLSRDDLTKVTQILNPINTN